MRYGILALLLAVAAYVFLCGCGTALNLGQNEPKVYGGVRFEVQTAAESLLPKSIQPARPDGDSRDDYLSGMPLFGVMSLLDLPFTLVGDTVTLPWTVSVEVKRLFEPKDKSEK